PLMPVYMAKAGGFFFIVFGIITVISALATINPIWMFGPYIPNAVGAGSQPDWYMGFLDGAVRIMPGFELNVFNNTIVMNLIVPAMILPALMIVPMILYPWIEAWASGDKGEHHVLDRPRNAPTRTALGVMALTFYMLLWISGGNDLIATTFGLSINAITWTLRFGLFIIPAMAFWATKRICLSLQRRDRDKLLHGRETGQIIRLPHGEFIEIHAPVNEVEKAKILSKTDIAPIAAPATHDAQGVAQRGLLAKRLQSKVSHFFYGDNIPAPTAAEITEAEAHMGHVESETRSEISQH
ncbi:MAG: ubiquinol-cytochrome c reductase cytochrome b subunit, partial [Actinobacteria bacterium]|nr:ubiquinol-cytochrome c reductase cytochrome b subunit [Actinomycetota bacterium]